MANMISPAAIPGRKRAFCSGLPCSINAGPTVLMVTNGSGAPAMLASSKKINCSVAA
ncbi:hypothetical protein PspTeo4_14096 [Pseudomonas sp. Teo4]|nr:hypothetical protein [Pseudomonas sp. Teo4]